MKATIGEAKSFVLEVKSFSVFKYLVERKLSIASLQRLIVNSRTRLNF